MATAQPDRYRGRDASNWVLTSLTLSLAFHVLVVSILGGVRMFDVEPFAERITRWFSVVEVPEAITPEIAALAQNLPEHAETPTPLRPEEVPLLAPSEHPSIRPTLGSDAGIGPPTRTPGPTRLPDAALPVIHRQGAPGIDQTLTQVGDLAPLRSPGGVAEAPGAGQPGQLRVAAGPPTLPPPAAPSLDLPAAPSERPATDTHAVPLAPPVIKPTATTVHLPAETPPAGILIALADTVARGETHVPDVLIGPGPAAETEDLRPIIPFGSEVGVNVQLYAEPGDPRCYFRCEIRVKERDKLPPIPKDVLFVCDVSLSIRSQELDLARDAIVRYLRGLRVTDRFNVIVFSEEARKLFPGFVEPTQERLQAAEKFIGRIPGQIKTDVYRALQSVIRDVADHSPPNRPCNLYFLSDGASTLGIRDVRRIVNDIGAMAQPHFAIFPFDAGHGGNRYLLDLLAYRSRGSVSFTDSFTDAPAVLDRVFRSYDRPVLMHLKPTYTDLNVDETYPAFIPNLYADQPIVIYGRCTPGQNMAIKLTGANPFARRALDYQAVPGAPDPQQGDIAREWARRKMHHLVSQMARVGETAALRDEIRRLGDRYQVPTPYAYGP